MEMMEATLKSSGFWIGEYANVEINDPKHLGNTLGPLFSATSDQALCRLSVEFLNGIASWPTVCFVKLWSYLAILKTYVFSSKTHPKSRSQDTRCGSTWALVGLGVTSCNSRINTTHKPCLLASKSGIPFFPLTYRWYPELWSVRNSRRRKLRPSMRVEGQNSPGFYLDSTTISFFYDLTQLPSR